jgi:glutaredoxin 3
MTVPVLLYTSPFCGFCFGAKKLLKVKGVDFDEIDVMMDPAKRDEMVARSGRRTVPQIFIGSHHVGGYTDLVDLDKDGRLDELLVEDA